MEVECEVKSAVSGLIFQYSNTYLVLKLRNGLFAEIEQSDAEWSCTEAAWAYLYAKQVWKYEADQVVIEKLSILDDIEGDDIASFFSVASIDGNEDVFLLLFEFAVQGIDFAQEETDVFFLIFSNEAIGDFIFE